MKVNKIKSYTLAQAQKKLEYYCAYQERCHKEVIAKLRTLGMIPSVIDKIISELIKANYLNETRFTQSFVRGKFRIKKWGKNRILQELKVRDRTMTIMSDKWIKKMSMEQDMISPFIDGQKKDGTISYGVSSYGYDARVSEEFKIFTNIDSSIVDPKNFSDKGFVDRPGKECIIPPNSFALSLIHI